MHTPINRRHASLMALALLGTAALPAAAADTYPSRSIKIIVPFPAGGTADIVARVVGAKMSSMLGQPVVVENRTGANGNIGTEVAAKAAPDGYTVLAGNTSDLIINPALYASVPFDTVKDFIPLAAVAASPNILVVNPSVPARSLRELLDLAKSKPGEITFASGGNGSSGQIAMEMLQNLAGVKFLHVPFQGGPQAVTALIGGQVQALFFPAPAVLQHVRAGKLRALATSSRTRTPVMPEVPTVEEAGVGHFEASPWFGFLLPAHTPEPVVNKLRETIVQAAASDDVQSKFRAQGIEARTEQGAAFADLIKSDLQRWGDAVRRSGAKVD